MKKIILIIISLLGLALLTFNLPNVLSRGVGYNKFVYDGIDVFFGWIDNFLYATFYFLYYFRSTNLFIL